MPYTLLRRHLALRRCRSCRFEDTTDSIKCPQCFDVLITVCYINGQRITPTFDEEQTRLQATEQGRERVRYAGISPRVRRS